MKTTNFITLPDGRRLSYAKFGKSDGYPIIYFHGGGACRLEPSINSILEIDRVLRPHGRVVIVFRDRINPPV